MDNKRKLLKSPSVKRRSRVVPVNQKVTLERVLGLTATNNASLTCDPNTGTVAYPAGCVVVLINPRKARQSHILNFTKKTLTAVAFSPDGKHIVTGESGHQPAVRVWNVEDKSQVSELHGHQFGVSCVAFSPNLKYLVSIGTQHDMMVNVWNWKTGTKVASNKISSKVNAVAFSHEGSMFVTVGNRHVKFWYLDSSKSRINETVPLNGRAGILGEQKNNYFCDVACGRGVMSKAVFCITLSGLLCQFNEKRLLEKFVELRTNIANCITVGEDYIFVGCANGIVRVFNVNNLHYVSTLPHPHHLGVDVSAALSASQMVHLKENAKYPDAIATVYDDIHKKVVCIYNDHSLYIWDVHDVKKVGKAASYLYHSACVWGVETAPPLPEGLEPILPPGTFATCSSDDTIRLWNLYPNMKATSYYKKNVYSNELLKIVYIDSSLGALKDVNYNPAGGTDKTDTNYDGKNGVRSVCISPDGRHLASGDRIGNVRVHDLEKMDLIKTIEAHDGDVLCLEYSTVVNAPRLMASTSRDRLLHVYDVEQDYGTLQTLGDHSASVTAAVFADNDEQLKLLSCSADKSLLFRSAQMDPDFQFNLVQHLVGKTTLYDMTVDPTHKYVATACQDRNIRIYNIQTAKQKKHYKGSVGDDGTLIKVQLDPSGIYAATSCTDKNLCIVDFATGDLVATMYGHSEISTGIKFTNDLKHLISVSGDGCVFVWRLADDMSKLMANRMEELGCTPVETVSVPTGVSDAFSLNVTSSKKEGEKAAEEQQDFMTPTKILAELIKHNESRGISPEKQAVSDYRFSIGGHLPKWAKTKIGDDKAKSQSPEDQAVKAKGRWAQRINNKGILAQVDGRTIELNANGERMSIKRFAVEETGDDTDSNIRRETMILPKAENTPRKVPVILNDEDDFDEEDDDDFFPLYQSERSSSSDPSEGKSSWDKQRNLSFGNQDDFEDMQEVIYYPPSEADSASSVESAYTVFAGNGNFNKSKRGTSTPRAQSRERNQDCDSESTEPISMDDLDEEDEGIPSIPTTPVIEEPPRTPDKDKTLNFKAVPFETFEKSLDEIEKEANTGVNASNFGASRLSISSRFLSRSQQPNARSMGIYPGYKQDNWIDAVPKKKDQLTKTMDETRKKLMAMSWKEESPENENPPEFAEKKEETEEDDTLKDLSSSPTITSAYDLRKISTDQDKNQTPTNRRLDTRTSLSSGSRTRPGSLPLENKRESRGRSTADTPTSRNSSSNLTNSRKSNEGVKLSKSSSVSNLVKDKKLRDSSSESRSSSASSLKVSGSSMTLPRKSSSKKMQAIKLSSKYTSSPNLAKAFESDSENEVQDSNLQSVADLSNSTPDLLDEDDDLAGHKNRRSLPRKSNVTTSRNSFGSAAKRSQSESRIKISRLSLPGSTPSSGRNTPNILIADDKELMPPPTGTSVMKGKSETSKSKHDKFLSKAIHSKRKTISDLTLDQAKDILKGKSGILSSNGKATDSAGVVKSARELPNISVVTSSSVAPKLSNVVSASTSLVATVKDESKINTVSAQLEREINYTAEEIRQQKAIDALNKLSVLDASPNDLPERDYTPTHNLGTTLESSTEWDDLHSSTSIRDRIAQLNSNISLNSLRTSSPRLMSSQTLSPSVTPSKSVSAGAASFKQVSPVNLNISPRSSSGIGSSLDSELAAKLFASPGTSPESLSSKNTVLHSGYCVDDNKNITLAEALDVVTSCHSKQSIVIPEENNAAIAPQHSNNRSSCNNDHLPLTHPQGQTPDSPCSLTTHQGVKNDNLRICMEALKDLKESVQKIRLAFEEVTKSADDNSREALTMLEDGAQETLLSLQEVLPAPKCVSSRTLPSIGNANRSPGMTHSISPPQMDASSSNVDQLLQHYSEKMVDRVELLLRDRLHTSSISNE